MTENETHELKNEGEEIKYRNALCPDCKEVEIKLIEVKYCFGTECKHFQCPNCGEKYAEWI
jgi:hypothetical protein